MKFLDALWEKPRENEKEKENSKVSPWERMYKQQYNSMAIHFFKLIREEEPTMRSSGQSSCIQVQRSRVRFPALPDFFRSGGPRNGVHSAS
jgi:hypothetical protein